MDGFPRYLWWMEDICRSLQKSAWGPIQALVQALAALESCLEKSIFGQNFAFFLEKCLDFCKKQPISVLQRFGESFRPKIYIFNIFLICRNFYPLKKKIFPTTRKKFFFFKINQFSLIMMLTPKSFHFGWDTCCRCILAKNFWSEISGLVEISDQSWPILGFCAFCVYRNFGRKFLSEVGNFIEKTFFKIICKTYFGLMKIHP